MKQLRTFNQVYGTLRKGLSHDEASQELAALVQTVEGTGRKGSITIKIEVSQSKGGAVLFADSIKTNFPQPNRDSTLFFACEDGSVSREHPRQKGIFDEDEKVTDIDQSNEQSEVS